jgi:hypothetical protein
MRIHVDASVGWDMEGWLANPSQDNNQVPNYLPIRKIITRLQPIADRYEK